MPSVSKSQHLFSGAQPARPFVPDYSPLRCIGEAFLPSRLAVDLAHVLDIDPEVDRWSCGRVVGRDEQRSILFEVHRANAVERLLVGDAEVTRAEVPVQEGSSASRLVCRVTEGDIDPIRLANAKLLLPYAFWRVSLDDRVRLLTVLEEEGSVTLGDCLSVFRHTSRPIAAVASLALDRVVALDLDTPLGSRTRVIRRPD